MFITVLFIIAKLWKQPRCPATNEWIKKRWYTYKMELYSVIRKNDMSFESKWMQLKDIMLSDVTQAQKDKSCMFSLMWKIDPKDKHIHKNKRDYVQIHL
jgi:hypothetical protein